METLRQVVDVELTPPRRLNPQIDRDIETICVKCLQKNHAHRYQSAEALEQDLMLYLSRRPITARPVSRIVHLYRWSQRNPIAAGAGLFAMVCITVAVVDAVG